jgi:hypothetical protein
MMKINKGIGTGVESQLLYKIILLIRIDHNKRTGFHIPLADLLAKHHCIVWLQVQVQEDHIGAVTVEELEELFFLVKNGDAFKGAFKTFYGFKNAIDRVVYKNYGSAVHTHLRK